MKAVDWRSSMFWIGLKIRMFCHRVDDFTELRFAAPLTIFRTANLVTRATSIALYTQYDAEHSNSTSDRRSTLSSLSSLQMLLGSAVTRTGICSITGASRPRHLNLALANRCCVVVLGVFLAIKEILVNQRSVNND